MPRGIGDYSLKFVRMVALLALPCCLALTIADALADQASSEDIKPQNWLTSGRDVNQSYFSPLKSIDKDNVKRLGYAWSARLGTFRGAEATPLVIDGVMYTSGYYGIVYAIDAATGKELWRYTPTISEQAYRNACCDTVNRGVAASHGKIYVAAVDGKLHAIDAATGKPVWVTDTIADHSLAYSSSGAPQIAHDAVVIGNSGADTGDAGVRGYVSGYDLDTGALKWRFFTVPPPPGQTPETPELAMAEGTWDPNRDKRTRGGGTVWDGITYDPAVNLVFVGTSNASPYGPKIGDALFTCSILAINPDSGQLVWHYQTTPGDRWDYDATQKIVLADLKIDSALRHVVMQASKNGFFYILDSKTGELLSAKNFSYVNWATGVDLKNGRPILTGKADYSNRPRDVYPSMDGAHNWQPMSFSPKTGLVYIPVNDMPNVWVNLANNGGQIKYVNGTFNVASFFLEDDYDPAPLRQMFGPLPDLRSLQFERPRKKLVRELVRAWDPVAQKTVWEQETSNGPRSYNGGIMSTAGDLVFQGRGNGELYVYAADTGAILKVLPTGGHILAAPMTYAVGDTQYVAVQTGYGGVAMAERTIPMSSAARIYDNENRIVVFRLDGGPTKMPAIRIEEKIPAPPPGEQAAADVERGAMLFVQQCARCHAFGPSITPDLRKLTPGLHELFEDIVLRGTFATEGMERFDDILSAADVKAVHAYLIDQQKQAYAQQEAAAKSSSVSK